VVSFAIESTRAARRNDIITQAQFAYFGAVCESSSSVVYVSGILRIVAVRTVDTFKDSGQFFNAYRMELAISSIVSLEQAIGHDEIQCIGIIVPANKSTSIGTCMCDCSVIDTITYRKR
jgi:hypothetical protein